MRIVYFYLGRDNVFFECLNSTDHGRAVLVESYMLGAMAIAILGCDFIVGGKLCP